MRELETAINAIEDLIHSYVFESDSCEERQLESVLKMLVDARDEM